MRKIFKRKRKMLTFIALILTIIIQLCCLSASAEGRTVEITSVLLNGSRVAVQGFASGNENTSITVLVLDKNNKMSYVDMLSTKSDGSFYFEFGLMDSTMYGGYTLKIGGYEVDTPAIAYFEYSNVQTVEEKAAICDMDVSLNGYIPTITGTIECFGERTMHMDIVNSTNNSIIANQTINSENGVFNFTYTLPSVLLSKNYDITFSCQNSDKTVFMFDLDLSVSALAVTLNGDIVTDSGARIEGNIVSSDLELINKNINHSGTRTLSYTLPKLIPPSVSFDVNLTAYETIEYIDDNDDDTYSTTYKFQPNAYDELDLYVDVQNIKNLSDKIITVNYNNADLQLTDLCTLTKQKELSTGLIPGTNVEILDISESSVSFAISNYQNANYAISGTISGLSFMALQDVETSIVVTIRDSRDDSVLSHFIAKSDER